MVIVCGCVCISSPTHLLGRLVAFSGTRWSAGLSKLYPTARDVGKRSLEVMELIGEMFLNRRHNKALSFSPVLTCDVMALGRGNSLASSINSAFSFSRLDRAAFLLFSFIAQRAAERPRGKGGEREREWEIAGLELQLNGDPGTSVEGHKTTVSVLLVNRGKESGRKSSNTHSIGGGGVGGN